MVAQFEPNF